MAPAGRFRVALVPPLASDGMLPLAAGLLKSAALADPFLRRRCDISIIEPGSSAAEAVRRVCALKPQLAGFTLYGGLAEAGRAAAEVKRRCGARIIFGGPLAGAAAPGDLLGGAADMAAAGDGEEIFPALLRALLSGGDLAGVKGLVWRDPAGAVRVNQPAPHCAALPPSPVLSGLFKFRRYPRAPLETSRGCGEACLYCTVTGRRGSFGLRRAAAELDRLLADQPELRTVFLTDPDVCRSPRAAELLRLLAGRLEGRGISAEIQVGLHNLDAGLAPLLNCGAFSLGVGVQSVSPETCRLAGRRADGPGLERKAALLAAGAPRARAVFSFIIGLPGDTERDCLRSFDWGLSRNAGLFFHRLRVYPGTRLGRLKERFGVKAAPSEPYFVESTQQLPPAALRRVLRAARELAPAANIVHADKYFGFLFRRVASGVPGAFPRLALARRVNGLARSVKGMGPALAEVSAFRDDGDWSGLDVKTFEACRRELIAGLAAMERAGGRRAFARRYAAFCAARLDWEKLGAGAARILRLAAAGGPAGRSLLVCGGASGDPGRFSSFGFTDELLAEEKYGQAVSFTAARRSWADLPDLPAAADGPGRFAAAAVSQVYGSMPAAGRRRFLRELLRRMAPGGRLLIADGGLGAPEFGPDRELTGGWLECRREDIELDLKASGWRLLRELPLGAWRIYCAEKA